MGRRKGIKDAALLAGGSAMGQALSFLRTVALARLLTKAEMAVAVLLQMTVFLFDMLSDLNIGTMLVQDPDGEAPPLQQTAHSVSAIRGTGMALVMLVMAWPLAAIFDAPQARWAFACLALIPLLRGMAHTDPWRFQRQKRYLPSVTVEVGSQFVSTVATLVLVWWLRNFTVMLWALLAQTFFNILLTHVLAQRRYRLGWDRPSLHRIMHFGWPLLLNGLLMFGIMQGDRLILGAQRLFPHYTRADLATYSVAFTLAMTPSLLLSRILSSLFLPRLAAVQSDMGAFEKQYRKVVDLVSMLAGLSALAFIMIGAKAVTLLYGQRYADAGPIVAWLGVMSSVRLLRSLTALAALARGDTRNSLMANIARVLGVVMAVVVALLSMNMIWIAVAATAGEIVALAVSVGGVRYRHGVSYRLYARAFVGMLVAVLVSTTITYTQHSSSAVIIASYWLVVSVAYGIAMLLLSPEIRRFLGLRAGGSQSAAKVLSPVVSATSGE